MSVDTWEAVLRVFAKKGSHLLQPNCNSVEELFDAQKHPERHRNLMVRVCGFSARFVNLSKRWQDESRRAAMRRRRPSSPSRRCALFCWSGGIMV